MLLANEILHIAHDNQSKSIKNSDQVSCPALTGKEKWMKETGPGTVIQILWNLSLTLINIPRYSKTEILTFCY